MQSDLEYTKSQNYQWMYLDSMKTSIKAIGLYQKNGFDFIERYNSNPHSDIFMRCKLVE